MRAIASLAVVNESSKWRSDAIGRSHRRRFALCFKKPVSSTIRLSIGSRSTIVENDYRADSLLEEFIRPRQ